MDDSDHSGSTGRIRRSRRFIPTPSLNDSYGHKDGVLSRLIFLGEAHLRWAASTYVDYYNRVRNHQGMDNKLLTPQFLPADGEIRCEQRLGGMLNYYHRKPPDPRFGRIIGHTGASASTPWKHAGGGEKRGLRRSANKSRRPWLAYERPAINRALNGMRVQRKVENLSVLASPARRRVEVFIRADSSGDWYHQGPNREGQT